MSAAPLILASGSKARQDMLRKAGLDFTAIPADIDEAAVLDSAGGLVADKAQELAREKALHVAKSNIEAYTIGSDQVLELDGQIFSKAANKDEALEKLKALRGKTHRLISAVAVARGEDVLWQSHDSVALTMHDLDDDFLRAYCARAGDVLTSCVGAYALEEHGSWLFQKVEGDYFTVLGMPLLPLLAYLRAEGFGP